MSSDIKPEEAKPPFFIMDGIPIGTVEGYTGRRFDETPPGHIALSSAANEGRPVTREEFLAACQAQTGTRP